MRNTNFLSLKDVKQNNEREENKKKRVIIQITCRVPLTFLKSTCEGWSEDDVNANCSNNFPIRDLSSPVAC